MKDFKSHDWAWMFFAEEELCSSHSLNIQTFPEVRPKHLAHPLVVGWGTRHKPLPFKNIKQDVGPTKISMYALNSLSKDAFCHFR